MHPHLKFLDMRHHFRSDEEHLVIHSIKPLIDSVESLIYPIKPLIDSIESFVHLVETVIDFLKSSIDLFKSSIGIRRKIVYDFNEILNHHRDIAKCWFGGGHRVNVTKE